MTDGVDRIREGMKVDVIQPGLAGAPRGPRADGKGTADGKADPAKREEMKKRLEAMTPEQREEFKKRRESRESAKEKGAQ